MSNLFINHSYVYKTSFLISSQSVQKHINLPFYGRRIVILRIIMHFALRYTEEWFTHVCELVPLETSSLKPAAHPSSASCILTPPGADMNTEQSSLCGTCRRGLERVARRMRLLCLSSSFGKKRRNSNWLGGKILGTQLLGGLFS